MQTFLPYPSFERTAQEEALAAYGIAICRTWVDRRHADSVLQQIEALAPDDVRTEDQLVADGLMPPWLGDERFHRLHTSSLVRKDPDWYRRFFPDVPDDLPYVWPEP